MRSAVRVANITAATDQIAPAIEAFLADVNAYLDSVQYPGPRKTRVTSFSRSSRSTAWSGAIGREMDATEPNWRRPDSLRLPNGQLIGPGCVRSPGTYVSPEQSGGVRVSASLASPAI